MRSTKLFVLFFLIGIAFHTTLTHCQVSHPETLKIRLVLSGTPQEVKIQKTPLRYNKRFAMSFHADDGIADIYTIGFKFFTGINGHSGRFPGLFFTDGCGNDVSFRLSSALFSFSAYNKEDMHRPGNQYNTVTWPQLDTMYRHGCGIYNHGFTSDAPAGHNEAAYSITRNESYIRRMLASTTPGGVKTRVLVNPNGIPEYSPVAFSLGYRYAFRMGAWTVMPETGMDVAGFQAWDKPLELNRVLAETIDVKRLADRLSERSVGGAHFWMSVFTHRIIDDYPLDKFYSDWNYIANTYGKQGSDDIWVASEEEVLNYLLIRQRVEVHHKIEKNILTISLSGNLPPDLRFYALSLEVETLGSDIIGIDNKSDMQITHSPTGNHKMLINLSWVEDGEADLGRVAENAVRAAQKNPTETSALVAMDYVMALPAGRQKEALRKRLCSLAGINYEQGFCPRTAD